MTKRLPRKGEGRPTKYNPKFVDEAEKYIATCKDKIWDWTKSVSTGKVDSESWERKIRVKLPTIEGFGQYLHVDKTTLYEWKAEYPEFSHALSKILAEQQRRLIENGLSGDYNPTIAKLILSANHGMREKSDITSANEPIKGNTVVFRDFDNDATNG